MSAIGTKVTEEGRQRIAAAVKAKWADPAHRAKHIAGITGRPVSEETRAKLRAAMAGRFVGERNPCWGKTHTTETRQKIGARNTGRAKTLGELARLSEANRGANNPMFGKPAPNRGKPLSEEVKAKVSAALKGKYCGPNSWSWRGGISFEPYCIKFNNEFKERVREFFGRTCVECGAPEEGYKLHVHHVNFRKDACCAEDVIPLFVSLCRSCHTRTNHNREYWEARFTAIISEQYGGRCYLPKQGISVGTEADA